jgi:hypothetical protein
MKVSSFLNRALYLLAVVEKAPHSFNLQTWIIMNPAEIMRKLAKPKIPLVSKYCNSKLTLDSLQSFKTKKTL